MMEERIAKLEVTSDSNASKLAALGNEMNDRFNRIETELSELRQNKADNHLTLYRLTNLQDEMNRRFADAKVDVNERFAALRSDIDLRFDALESAQVRGFDKASADLANSTSLIREDYTRRTSDQRDEINRRFTDFRDDMNLRFAESREERNRRFDAVDARFDKVEASIGGLREELHTFIRWSISSQIVIVLGILALAAKAYLT